MCLFNNTRHTCGCEVEDSVRPCQNFTYGLQKFYCKNTAANTRIVKDSEEACFVCRAEKNSEILRKARERWRILGPQAVRDPEGEPDAGFQAWVSPLRGNYSRIRIVSRSRPRKLYQFPFGEYGERESETEGYGSECFRGTEEVEIVAPGEPSSDREAPAASISRKASAGKVNVPAGHAEPDARTDPVPTATRAKAPGWTRPAPPTAPASSVRPKAKPPVRKRAVRGDGGWHLINSISLEINEEPVMVQKPDHWADVPGQSGKWSSSDEDELEEEGVLVKKPNYGPEGSNVPAKLCLRMERERAEAALRRWARARDEGSDDDHDGV